MSPILFFGRVGELLGPEGSLDLPAEGLPVREIRRLLAERDEVAADALLRSDVRASVDLVVVGAPGCLLYQDLADLSAVLTDAAGAASMPLGIPLDPLLIGQWFYGQGGSFDPAANAFGWTTSNYVRVQMGS